MNVVAPMRILLSICLRLLITDSKNYLLLRWDSLRWELILMSIIFLKFKRMKTKKLHRLPEIWWEIVVSWTKAVLFRLRYQELKVIWKILKSLSMFLHSLLQGLFLKDSLLQISTIIHSKAVLTNWRHNSLKIMKKWQNS